MSTGLVIVNADLGGQALHQIRIERHNPARTSITEVGDRVKIGRAMVLNARGRAVLPSFTDHHLHLHALAIAESSVRCGPPQVRDPIGLSDALISAITDNTGWVRGIGYTESVAGPLTRDELDAFHATRPVRVAHRSGALWMLNSLAIESCAIENASHPGIERDVSGRATGRLWRADGWLRNRLPPSTPPSLQPVGQRLRSLGIAEVTDATPDLDDTAIAHILAAVDNNDVLGQVHLLGVPLDRQIKHPRVSVGPFKIVIADSELPTLDGLADCIATAHASGRAVAVHCVSRIAFALLMAAFDITGVRPGDRIEHAGVLPADAAAILTARGLVVVTQPGFLHDRGDDFLDDSDPSDRPDLYRCGSLVKAGVPVALSSDAPYGPIDPWQTISSAIRRRTLAGRIVGDSTETLSIATALALHTTPAADPSDRPRQIAVGDSGDLIVVDRPMVDLLSYPTNAKVACSTIGLP